MTTTKKNLGDLFAEEINEDTEMIKGIIKDLDKAIRVDKK